MAIDTKKGVPGINLAALNSISDENTRSVLQSLIDGWHVRNGNSGNGDSAFVTRAELSRGFQTGILPGTGGGSISQSIQSLMGVKTSAEIGAILSKMQTAIMESPLFKSLGERITLVDAATVANGNAITTEITNRANADNAIYTTYNAQFSVVNSSISSLTTTQTTQASTISALSSSVTTLTAQTSTNTTAISTEASARASADGVINSKYTVKIDSNGYVSGFGLISTANNSTPYSAFIVRADQFAIGSPSGPGVSPAVPFIVNTTTDGYGNPPGVYMSYAMIGNAAIGAAQIADAAVLAAKIGTAQINNGHIQNGQIDTAKIANAAITNAKIGNAEVDTLKVAGNSITVSGSLWDWGGGTTASFYAPDYGTLSVVAFVAGTDMAYDGRPTLHVILNGSFDAMTVYGPDTRDDGSGNHGYSSATGVGSWNVSPGINYVGFYVDNHAYVNDTSKLLWFLTMR